MRHSHSLRSRVALTFAWFGALGSLLLAVGIFLGAHDVSRRLMDETLRAEMDDYMARRGRNPASLPPASVSLMGFVDSQPGTGGVPEAIALLDPGSETKSFHNINYNKINYRVLVSRQGQETFYMLFNTERQRAREERFIFYLLCSVLLVTFLAAIGGWWLAGRVTAPIIELARKVASSDPIDPLPNLDPKHRGDEVALMAEAFDRYIGRLRAFGERERAFISYASHEFRTPLAVIRSCAELLLADQTLNERQRRRVERIDRAAWEMSSMSEALLHLAREENTQPPRQKMCDMKQLVMEIVENYAHLTRDRTIQVETHYQAAPKLAVERSLAMVVVSNLIRNAIAHSQGNKVQITLAENTLEVSDKGPGIAEEEIPLLFQHYYRGSSSSGHGIGLSLVKRICDVYGWNVTIESRAGEGTTVHLFFSATTEWADPVPDPSHQPTWT
ncbi:MAG: HAMP domain-containing histidine kinase [Magnetococcales bacterium]|nr:HAMP domain-containing histidine kinase [Magnetococcales bacterium]